MSPIKMQRLESGIRLAAELFGNINAQEIEGIAGLLSDDCVLESAYPAPDGTVYSGKEQIRQYYEVLFREREGIHFRTEEMLGFGHRCIVRWESTWNDDKGTKRTFRGTDIIKEKNDLICEMLSYGKCKTSD